MKVIPLGVAPKRKTPLHKCRHHIDSLKADFIREHNKKIREQKAPGL